MFINHFSSSLSINDNNNSNDDHLFFFGCYRKKAPPLSFLTFCKIFFLSLIGYVLCSTSKTLMNIMARIKFFKFFFFFLNFRITFSLDLYGIALIYTSATLAAATTNCLPAITFFLAVLLR